MISDKQLATVWTMTKGPKVRYAHDSRTVQTLEEQGYTCTQEPTKGSIEKPKTVEQLNTNNDINSDEKNDTRGWNPKVETTEEIVRGNGDKTQDDEEQTATTKPKRRRN